MINTLSKLQIVSPFDNIARVLSVIIIGGCGGLTDLEGITALFADFFVNFSTTCTTQKFDKIFRRGGGVRC